MPCINSSLSLNVLLRSSGFLIVLWGPWVTSSAWPAPASHMPRACLRLEFQESQGCKAPSPPTRTHFRVSFMLQAEQEKQFTHQALLRADTTVRPDVGLASPTQNSCRSSYANQSQMDLQL